MVAFETAVRLDAQGTNVLTAVLENSPLHQRLRELNLKFVILNPQHKYLSLATIRQLRTILRAQKITTVLVQQLRDLWYLRPALVGFPQVRVIGLGHMWIDVRKQDRLHRWIYGRLQALVALTAGHRRNLLAHLPVNEQRLHVLPNTVDSQRFTPTRRSPQLRAEFAAGEDALLIGVVSRLDPKKGLLQVVSAAAYLKSWNVPFTVVIVGRETIGEEHFRDVLLAEVTKLDLQKQVHLAGQRSDIETVMASFDVLLMPSPEETFGRVLIEAMASGVPVVAVAGGGVPDVVDQDKTGVLVPPGDVEAMAEALRHLAQDPSRRQRLALAALEKSRTVYNPERVDAELARLIVG